MQAIRPTLSSVAGAGNCNLYEYFNRADEFKQGRANMPMREEVSVVRGRVAFCLNLYWMTARCELKIDKPQITSRDIHIARYKRAVAGDTGVGRARGVGPASHEITLKIAMR
jgi:hypothetical protein